MRHHYFERVMPVPPTSYSNVAESMPPRPPAGRPVKKIKHHPPEEPPKRSSGSVSSSCTRSSMTPGPPWGSSWNTQSSWYPSPGNSRRREIPPTCSSAKKAHEDAIILTGQFMMKGGYSPEQAQQWVLKNATTLYSQEILFISV